MKSPLGIIAALSLGVATAAATRPVINPAVQPLAFHGGRFAGMKSPSTDCLAAARSCFRSTALDRGKLVSNTGLLVYSSGPVVSNQPTYIYLIFWGPDWQTNSTFTGDKITAMQSFFQGVGGSSWLNTISQYSASTNVSYYHTTIDNTTEPDPYSATVISEVCNQGIADSTALYVVYSEFTPYAGFLGDHFTGTCTYSPLGITVPVNIAFILNLDAYPQTVADGYHSQKAGNLATVSGHELAEALTDPHANAWYAGDTYGEVGDKCTTTFPGSNVVFSNSSQWRIQMLWSNNAYRTSSGYPGYFQTSTENEAGCVAGS